jgi:hypothetical protein
LSSYVMEKRGLEESVRRGQFLARHICTQRSGSKRPLSRQELNAQCEVGVL